MTATDAPPRATPTWLTRPEPGLCACCTVDHRRRANFAEQTIRGGTRLIASTLFSQDLAERDGFLQRVDARAKLLALAATLLATALVHHVADLIVLYALVLAAVALARLPVAWFLRRVWLSAALFTGLIALPAVFSFVTPGQAVLTLGPLAITEQGLTTATLLVLRAATSISLVLLCTLTTPWPQLLAALRSLFVPRTFVLVIAMAYRYIFHLVGSVEQMFTAHIARVGREQSARRGRAFVGAAAGALFSKSYALSEEVHDAMTARGYRGDTRTLARARVRATDVLVALCAIALVALVIGLQHA